MLFYISLCYGCCNCCNKFVSHSYLLFYNSNHKVNSHPTWHAAMDGDIDALITIEVILIEPGLDGEKLHIANVCSLLSKPEI